MRFEINLEEMRDLKGPSLLKQKQEWEGGGQARGRNEWFLTLCSRPRGFRILCILKILSKPQEASRGFEGWHCNPFGRCLPIPLDSPAGALWEKGAGITANWSANNHLLSVFCSNPFLHHLILV